MAQLEPQLVFEPIPKMLCLLLVVTCPHQSAPCQQYNTDHHHTGGHHYMIFSWGHSHAGGTFLTERIKESEHFHEGGDFSKLTLSRCIFCQAQFKFSNSSVQFELRLSLKHGYYHPPTPWESRDTATSGPPRALKFGMEALVNQTR